MKRYCCYLMLLTLLLTSCFMRHDTVELTDWYYSGMDGYHKATVPGFVHLDLMADGAIPDPYYATNEDSVRWVGEQVWHYTTDVERRNMPKGDTLWLVFDGLAGVAVVTVDEDTLGVTDNMFVRHTYMLIPGDRERLAIGVTFLPLNDSVREAEYGITLPDRRAFTRIAPYQQGWDWGPNMPTCGIWQKVYITNNLGNLNNGSILNDLGSQSNRVVLHQEQDSIGKSFTFYRDGKPIFVKGANWIPVHSFPVDDEAQRARYRLLLRSAKEANFNMIRVWGGGIYEPDYFYDLCDSLGLMVWQDFNFSTMLYPDDDKMLASIGEEARQQVARIAQHPCVVLWCGNNEVKNGWEDWGWQDVYQWTDDERERLQHGIDTIFGEGGILARAVAECDPMQRQYISTSPLYGWGHPECVTHGDSHYWGVWWGEMPFEVYAEKTGRFMSEYGFQSYPMMSSIRQFCPEDELDIDSPTLQNHQKHGRGLQIIDSAMQRYYGFDSRTLSLDNFAYVSQLLQAWGTGYGILQHISRRPHCMGTLYWQLNDCWPVASWSSIDYYGNWKALHYRVQALYSDQVDLDYWNDYYSTYPKDREYPDPKYTIGLAWESNGSMVVTLYADTDLYDLYIETEPHINGHFDRNFVNLKAGDKFTARFRPADPKADTRNVKIKARTLNELYFYNGR